MSSLIPVVLATLGAVAMALAFPRLNAVALAPVGAAALFWAWFRMSPKRAFWTGWLAGTVYFAITFWWFAETAGALIAPFGFLLALGPAVGDAFFQFALGGFFIALAARALGDARRANRALVPLASAAIVAFLEWLRSEGLGEIGVPFGSLGFTQVRTPLAPLAAYAGTYGVTFAVCAIGAYLAYAIRMRGVRGSGVDALAGAGAIVIAAALAWTFWPARTLAAPTVRVAAIQGNIAQSLKFKPGSLERAIATYTLLTREAATARPSLVVWPETVIPVNFARAPELRAQFAALARAIHAELAIGTFDVEADGEYNVLAFDNASGTPDGAFYRKRRLVPFAEHVPWRPLFAWIPWIANVSNFSEGSGDVVVSAGGERFAPLICWESAFAGLGVGAARDGAGALIVATDDAWFGTTAGPYQHAEIAQMRALETGRWIVRAASTGISGIIAPDGRFTHASRLDETAIVTGDVGPPAPTLFARIGPEPIAALFALLYAAIVAAAWPRGARRA